MLPQRRACVSSSSTCLVELILLCLHSGAMGLGNPASLCRQAQAHPSHPCVACTASCQQKGSLLDKQTGLLRESRQQHPQWLLTEPLTKLTCWMSDIPCAKTRKVSPLLHFTLLIVNQSNPLFAEELPTANRQLAVHTGFLTGRCLCLGPVCHWGAEGTVDAALGAHSGTHSQKYGGETSTRWISSHREALCTGLDCEQCTHVCNYAALCWLQHREQIHFHMLLLLLTFKWIL